MRWSALLSASRRDDAAATPTAGASSERPAGPMADLDADLRGEA